MRLAVALSAFVLGLISITIQATGATFGEDNRRNLGFFKGYSMGRIGLLIRSDDYSTTAFLISRCHILTSAHAIGLDYRKFHKNGKTFDFFLGQSRPAFNPEDHFYLPFLNKTSAKPVRYGNFIGNRRDYGEDWAVFKLADCLGDQYGWLRLAPLSKEDMFELIGTPIALVGFPWLEEYRGGPVLSVDGHCYLRGKSDTHGWLHDCDESPRNSGSPIFLPGSEGEPDDDDARVIGIHSATNTKTTHYVEWRRDRTNYLVGVDSFYDRIVDCVGEVLTCEPTAD